MAEPITLSTLAVKFAEAAGAYMATHVTEAIAQEVATMLFGQLATKEDLRKAVEELKRHIDTRFEELQIDEILALLYSTDELFKRFQRAAERKENLLEEADTSLVKAYAVLTRQFEKDNCFAYKNVCLAVKYAQSRLAVSMLMKPRGIITHAEIEHQLTGIKHLLRYAKDECRYFETAKAVIVRRLIPDLTPDAPVRLPPAESYVGKVYRGPGTHRNPYTYESASKAETTRRTEAAAARINSDLDEAFFNPLDEFERAIDELLISPEAMLDYS